MKDGDKTRDELINELVQVRRQSTECKDTFDAVSDIVASISPNFELIKLNRAGYEGLGKKPGEVIGKKCYEVVHGLDAPIDGCPCKEAMGTKKAGVGEITQGGRYYIATACPILDKNNEVTVFAHTIKDITEIKKAEEEIKRARDEYLMITNLTGDIIVRFDREGKRTFVNHAACQFWGKTREQLMAGTLGDHTHPDDQKKTMTGIEELKTKKVVKGVVNRQKTPKGWRTVEWNGAVISDEEGRYVGIQVTGRDITERKKAEERIREYTEELRIRNRQLKVETEKAKESDRLKSEFLANMSHEIRTPLMAIKGAAYLLDKSSLSSEQKKLCSMIGQSGENLLSIINNILDLALIEAGEVKLEEEEFSLRETLERIISGFKLQAKEKRLELKMILPSDLPLKILSDEGKITEILSNLITNALKFTEEGKVEVRLERLADSKIQFHIKDTGIGIPQDKLSLIFNKFEQVDGTIRRKHGGTGLGLTIVKELVNLLGGKIKVTSEPGKGSTFSFSFPYRISKEKVAPDQDLTKLKPKIKKKTKKDISILIAEDDDFNYYIINRFLKDYTTTRAKDGKDVLEKIEKKRFDLILMDIQMPEMDGLTATRKIREKNKDLPIIALTAKSMKGDEEKCLAAGCTDYISKPITPDELIAKVNQYSAKSRLRK